MSSSGTSSLPFDISHIWTLLMCSARHASFIINRIWPGPIKIAGVPGRSVFRCPVGCNFALSPDIQPSRTCYASRLRNALNTMRGSVIPRATRLYSVFSLLLSAVYPLVLAQAQNQTVTVRDPRITYIGDWVDQDNGGHKFTGQVGASLSLTFQGMFSFACFVRPSRALSLSSCDRDGCILAWRCQPE